MKLRTWLNKTRITVTALAKLIKTDRSYIYGWLRGDHVPSDKKMARVKEVTLNQVNSKSDLKE